jgi:hypothetical protein
MYNAKTVRDYYDSEGTKEWDRLDASAHARLVYHLHNHFLSRPDYWGIFHVAETGDLAPRPDIRHPARHFYTSEELHRRLEAAGLGKIRLASAPSNSAPLYAPLALIEKNEAAWATVLRLEEQAYCVSGLSDSGEVLMAKGIVQDER